MTKVLRHLPSVDSFSDGLTSNFGYIIGIDASRNRSGGAIAHLRGLLESADPRVFGIVHVHLWAHDDLLSAIKSAPWLTVHHVADSKRSIFRQLWWQYAKLPSLARDLGVRVMFNSDAGSVCPFPVSATLSQDMLSFEPGEIQRYAWGTRARFRLELLKFVQLRRLKRSQLAVFLSQHAFEVIGQHISLANAVVIPHGIDDVFREASVNRRPWPDHEPIRCLYVSNAAPYKHQWNVVKAVAKIRRSNQFDLKLRLVGGGRGPSYERLLASVNEFDPQNEFVELVEFAPHHAIPGELAAADLFIFASSCENLPITLLEAMASGIVICSSNRGPMPEVMGPDACFFDPERPESISDAILKVVLDPVQREQMRQESLTRSSTYTWNACANKTWAALASIV